ncbi:MAG: DUF3306 domain-containing protein [Gammaproteobacteria bacterium]|nr:DUF3306 domain-containing protein [Gammaproteobacteria bacterium]
MSQKEEGLLTRWSRRKLQTQEDSLKEEVVLAAEHPDIANEISVDGSLREVPEQPPVLTDEDMPPIESLTEDSDFSGFMSSGVSDKLRNMALKKMFHVPAFNIRDGLDEYDDDYTFFEPLGDIVTSDMKHQVEMLEKKRAEEAELKPAEEMDETEQEQKQVDEVVAESDFAEDLVEEPIQEELNQSEIIVEKL